MDAVDDFFPSTWDPSPSALSFHPAFSPEQLAANLAVLPPDDQHDSLSILPHHHDPTHLSTDMPSDLPPSFPIPPNHLNLFPLQSSPMQIENPPNHQTHSQLHNNLSFDAQSTPRISQQQQQQQQQQPHHLAMHLHMHHTAAASPSVSSPPPPSLSPPPPPPPPPSLSPPPPPPPPPQQQQQQQQQQTVQRRKSQPHSSHQHSAQTASQPNHHAQQHSSHHQQNTPSRRTQPQRPTHKQKLVRQQKQLSSRKHHHHHHQQQQHHPVRQSPQSHDYLLQQQHLQQQQHTRSQHQNQQHHSHQNIFATITPPAVPTQPLSNTSIPTPTIATGTTITGTPSTTNSTHRSPPHTPRTPHSSNRPKSTVASAQRETQSDVQSSIDKNTAPDATSKHQSIATSTAKHSQSSSQINAHTGPASSSAQHPMLSTGRIIKPRDKQARLRKRLKCCSHEQLVEQIIELVRTSKVSEKLMFELTPRVDIGTSVAKCEEMRDAIFAQLPDDPNSSPPPYDSNAYRRCKKALANFKSTVLAMGKTLGDAALWTEVLEYCVAAAAINEQTPIWTEPSHNKMRASVSAKLEQLATRAATALTKSKSALVSSDENLRLIENCRKLFPGVAIKLEGQEPGSVVEGSIEQVASHPNFDGPIISSNQIEIGM